MRVSLSKKILVSALRRVAPAAPAANCAAWFSCSAGTPLLTASSGGVECSVRMGGGWDGGGFFGFGHAQLSRLAGKLPDGDVVLETADNGRLSIVAGGVETFVDAVPASEYMEPTPLAGTADGIVGRKDMHAMLSRAMPWTLKDGIGEAWRLGVRLTVADGTMTVEAVNGAVCLRTTVTASGSFDVVVPRLRADALMRWLRPTRSTMAENIVIRLSSGRVGFVAADSAMFVGVLPVDGWADLSAARNMVMGDGVSFFRVSAPDVADAVGRVVSLVGGKSAPVRLTPKDNILEAASEDGSVTTKVVMETALSGKSVSMLVNGNAVVDILKSFEGSAEVRMSGAESPFSVRDEISEALAMPLVGRG